MIIPLPIDWTANFTERRAYRTTVLMRRNGKEQRTQHRARAMRTWEFTLSAGDPAEAQLLERALREMQDAVIYAPFAPHVSLLTSAASAGSTFFALDTTSRDFTAGGTLLVGLREALTISAVTSTGVTVTTPSTASYALGVAAYPSWPGALTQPPSIDRVARGASRARISIELDPTILPASTATAGALATNLAIGTVVPDRLGREDTIDRTVERFISPGSGFEDVWPETSGRYAFNFRTLFDTLTLTQAFWSWYDGVLGALIPSWIPSWQEDFTLASPLGAGDTNVTVSAVGYVLHADRKYLAIVQHPGALAVREILAATSAGPNEILQLASSGGLALTPATGHLLSLARYARLQEDPVELAWHRPALAETTLRFIEVRR